MLLRLLLLRRRPRIISARPIQDAIGRNLGEVTDCCERRRIRLAISTQIATRANAFVRAVAVIRLCVTDIRPALGIDIRLFEDRTPQSVLGRQQWIVEHRAHTCFSA